MARMNAERGTRYRLEGLLLNSKRGPVLQIDSGGVWALDADDVRHLFGQRVRLEGIRSGYDRIDVEWIGPANEQS